MTITQLSLERKMLAKRNQLLKEVLAERQKFDELSKQVLAGAGGMIPEIQKAVAAEFGIDPAIMLSRSKLHHVAFPRQVAMYLCRRLTRFGLTTIATAFDRSDHGTILWAVNRVQDEMDTNPAIRERIVKLEERIRQNRAPELTHFASVETAVCPQLDSGLL